MAKSQGSVATGMTVTVRLGIPADLDAFVRGTLGNAFETEGLRLDPEVVRRGVSKLLADHGKGLCFIAQRDGKAVGTGYVTFEWSDWHDAWYWWIQSLYVVADSRGTGVYSAMWKAIQDEARQRGGVRAIRLYVEKGNELGLRAYRGHGMEQLPYLVFETLLEGP
jgi:ribosomal protein S18 acetylase RimI-like enzyme